MNEYLLGGGGGPWIYISSVDVWCFISENVHVCSDYVLQIKNMMALNQGQEFPAGVESKTPRFNF